MTTALVDVQIMLLITIIMTKIHYQNGSWTPQWMRPLFLSCCIPVTVRTLAAATCVCILDTFQEADWILLLAISMSIQRLGDWPRGRCHWTCLGLSRQLSPFYMYYAGPLARFWYGGCWALLFEHRIITITHWHDAEPLFMSPAWFLRLSDILPWCIVNVFIFSLWTT